MKKKLTIADVEEMLSKDQFIDETTKSEFIELTKPQYELLLGLKKEKEDVKKRIKNREFKKLKLSGISGYLINKKENK